MHFMLEASILWYRILCVVKIFLKNRPTSLGQLKAVWMDYRAVLVATLFFNTSSLSFILPVAWRFPVLIRFLFVSYLCSQFIWFTVLFRMLKPWQETSIF
jgi:hypothetical protein